jgi:hypothetical protein
MKRMMMSSLAVLLLAAPVWAGDKTAARSLSASGTVTAVSPGSFTIKAKGGEQTFATDRSTVVAVKGATRKMAALNAANKPAILTEFVEVGADVSVTYSEKGASRHAAKVMVLWAPAPLSAKK